MQVMQDSCIPWLGSVPSHWKRGKLKQYIFEISEKNFPVKTTNILSLTNKLGVVPYEEKGNQGNTAKEKYDEYKLAYPDTIVANSMNILIGSVGYCFYFGCVSPVYYVFKNFKNGNLRYINYIFQTTEFQKCLRQFSNGILEIRQRVSAKTILNQDFFFPDLDEQNAIVEYLETKCAQIDTIIAKEQSVIEKLQEYRQSIITEMVVRGVNTNELFKPINCEWIDMIPNGWSLIKLGMIANVKSNLVSPLDYPNLLQISPENIEKDTGKVLNIKTVRESGIISDNHLFNKGQIIYSKVRPTLNKVIIADFDGLCSADMYPIETIVNVKYLVYFMRSKLFVSQVDRISSDRVKMPKINKMELKQLFCFIPSEEDQKRIVELLDSKCERIDMVILGKQVLIDKLTEYKKSLIYEVVTGKKEVPHV